MLWILKDEDETHLEYHKDLWTALKESEKYGDDITVTFDTEGDFDDLLRFINKEKEKIPIFEAIK